MLANLIDINLRHNKRGVRIHTVRIGIVNAYSSILHSMRSKLLGDVTACAEQRNVDTLKAFRLSLLNRNLLAFKCNFVTC
ncbi:hypothetical protein D3C80_1728170 [compost metagenome]